jgi:pimeloyl-ACP methyl ester carboxylesterase
MNETVVEPKTQRPFQLDVPDDLEEGEDVTVLLCLHGGGLSAEFQRSFFPAHDFCEKYRLVVATPDATERFRRWDPVEDTTYLEGVVDETFARLSGARAASFWLVGHSQGGVTTSFSSGITSARESMAG